MKRMKQIGILLLACLTGLAGMAQILTVTINGNGIQKILIDDLSYDFESGAANNFSRTITLNNLRPGTHNIHVISLSDLKLEPADNRSKNDLVLQKRSAGFTVKDGYDVSILVTTGGVIQVRDKKITPLGLLRTPVSDDVFNTILKAIQDQWRDTRKTTLAQTAFTNNNNYFTAAQARILIQAVAGDANRLTLAKLAYNRITDPDNFGRVQGLIVSEASRNELGSYIKSLPAKTSIQSFSESFRITDDASFEALVQQVKQYWLPAERTTAITEIFANETRYFTTDQVRRLVELLDFESSRLLMLKDAYTHVTDPQNFSKLYRLLSSQTTRDELAVFVNAATKNSGLVNYNYNKPAMSEDALMAIHNNAVEAGKTNSVSSYLSTVFGDVTNFYTTEQVFQLISMTEGESTRLGLARAAYRGVTDPENYVVRMNQLFTTEASKEDLDRYISAYRGAN
jgi:hypothetical protein